MNIEILPTWEVPGVACIWLLSNMWSGWAGWEKLTACMRSFTDELPFSPEAFGVSTLLGSGCEEEILPTSSLKKKDLLKLDKTFIE